MKKDTFHHRTLFRIAETSGFGMRFAGGQAILHLDEVAAGFDHHFREFFYRELLPRLRAEGRTLLVVSHDDRYFGCADRVLTLEYGAFVSPETGDRISPS
jgi:ABC-type siderophore export system fused ATPase/permease subunit